MSADAIKSGPLRLTISGGDSVSGLVYAGFPCTSGPQNALGHSLLQEVLAMPAKIRTDHLQPILKRAFHRLVRSGDYPKTPNGTRRSGSVSITRCKRPSGVGSRAMRWPMPSPGSAATSSICGRLIHPVIRPPGETGRCGSGSDLGSAIRERATGDRPNVVARSATRMLAAWCARSRTAARVRQRCTTLPATALPTFGERRSPQRARPVCRHRSYARGLVARRDNDSAPRLFCLRVEKSRGVPLRPDRPKISLRH